MKYFFDYAPLIMVILGFIWQNKIFVTPEQLEKRFAIFEHNLEKKFVLKETHDIAISEMKSDIEEIKEKLDKIYDMLLKA